MTAQVGEAGRWRDIVGLRVFTAWGPCLTVRIVAAVAVAIGMAWVIGNSRVLAGPPVGWIADTQYYYGAGERLDAGHLLYAYSPGDRQLTVDPFAFAGPFLYPPLLGVLWRPLALLPFDVIVTIWWALGLVTMLGALAWLLRRGHVPTAIGILVLLVPLVETAWSGNVSAFLTPLMIWTWIALERGHERRAGLAIGFAAVAKLTPAFLIWWLVVQRRWRAVAAALSASAAFLLLSIAGAGTGSYLEYLRVTGLVGQTGGTEASLTGVLRSVGAGGEVLAAVAPVVALVGIALVFALRARPRLAWGVAIATGVLASPVLNLTNVTLLLAAFVAADVRIGLPHRSRPLALEGSRPA